MKTFIRIVEAGVPRRRSKAATANGIALGKITGCLSRYSVNNAALPKADPDHSITLITKRHRAQ